MVKATSSLGGFGTRTAVEGSGFRRFFSELSTSFLAALTLVGLAIVVWVGLAVVHQLLAQQKNTLDKKVNAIVQYPELLQKEQTLLGFNTQIRSVHEAFTEQERFLPLIDFLGGNTHRQVQWELLNVRTQTLQLTPLTDTNQKEVVKVLAQGPLSLSDLQKKESDKDPQVIKKAVNDLLSANRLKSLPDGRLLAITPSSTLDLQGNAASFQALAEQVVALSAQYNLVQAILVKQVSVSQNGGVSFSLQVQLKPNIFTQKPETPPSPAGAAISS